MKFISVLLLSLLLPLPALSAPNNAQLNEKIRVLKDRIALLEETVAELKETSPKYAFAGFTVETIEPTVPNAFTVCREEFGPNASIATTEEVLAALRDGTFSARADGYVLSTDVQYNMGVARDKYLLEMVHGAFIVVGIGGKTSQDKVGAAPIACSVPR